VSLNAKEYLVKEIGEKTKGEISQEDHSKIREQIYVPLKNEDWDGVEETIIEIGEEYGIDFSEQLDYLSSIKEPDMLESVNEPEIDKDASTREKLLIQRQVRNTEEDEILARTDEQIGVDQIFDLQEQIYKETGKKCFIISKQREWEGRVSVEIGNGSKKKFELMAVYENADGHQNFKHFGESNPNKGWNKVEEFNQSFYQYKFVSEDQEYLVLSTKKLDTVRCKLSGTQVSINDYKTVGENRKLPVHQDIIFVNDVQPAIKPFSEEQLEEMQDKVDMDYFAEHVFGVYRHPEWFEEFMLSILSVGEDFDGYPPHFLWLAPPDTGKSTFLESLLIAFDEPQKEPFEGGGSTIKGLTPSFKQNPPKEGMLLKSQRIAAVDEKLNLLKNTVEQENSATQDAFRPMTSLLEHKARKFESGNGSISGQMEAQMIAATNDAYGISNLIEAQQKLDKPYLSRFIQYEQLDSHVKFIDEQKNSINCEYEDGLPSRDDEFISLMDTLRDVIRVDVNSEEVGNIHERLSEKVPAGFQQTFRARHKHHIKCTVAGLAKIRYFTEDREMFIAYKEDYERAEELWEILITSWGSVDMASFSENARLEAIPHSQRMLYQVIDEEPGVTIKDLADKTDVDRLSNALTGLKEADLIQVDNDRYFPYWFDLDE